MQPYQATHRMMLRDGYVETRIKPPRKGRYSLAWLLNGWVEHSVETADWDGEEWTDPTDDQIFTNASYWRARR